MNMAATLEIDAVIDPAATRSWLVHALAATTHKEPPATGYVDSW
jgi:acetyl-CoA carboxylase carboxyltransferase component